MNITRRIKDGDSFYVLQNRDKNGKICYLGIEDEYGFYRKTTMLDEANKFPNKKEAIDFITDLYKKDPSKMIHVAEGPDKGKHFLHRLIQLCEYFGNRIAPNDNAGFFTVVCISIKVSTREEATVAEDDVGDDGYFNKIKKANGTWD